MRLPCDARAIGADRNRSDPEDDVDAEPDREKCQHARIAQGAPQRQRGHLRCRVRIAAAKRQKTALHEGEPDCGRHRAGHRRGGADHRRHRMLVGDQMRQRAGNRGHRHEQEEPRRPEATRHRTSERQQPQHVETDMAEIGMQQRIGHERPDFGGRAAGKRRRQQRGIVALRNEAEHLDRPVFQVRRQQHAQMDRRQKQDIRGQGGRQRQDRFARGIRGKFWRGVQGVQRPESSGGFFDAIVLWHRRQNTLCSTNIRY